MTKKIKVQELIEKGKYVRVFINKLDIKAGEYVEVTIKKIENTSLSQSEQA